MEVFSSRGELFKGACCGIRAKFISMSLSQNLTFALHDVYQSTLLKSLWLYVSHTKGKGKKSRDESFLHDSLNFSHSYSAEAAEDLRSRKDFSCKIGDEKGRLHGDA